MGDKLMVNKTIEDAIFAINPNAAYKSTPPDNVDGITWLFGTTPISKEDLEAKKVELQAESDALQYQRDRNPDDDDKVHATNFYPSIGDQLDMQYHDKKDGTTTWEDAVQAVKDAHPKP